MQILKKNELSQGINLQQFGKLATSLIMALRLWGGFKDTLASSSELQCECLFFRNGGQLAILN